MSQSPDQRRVPVTVVSGFLGAGKTTLLRHILSEPDGERFGVLVNDFGAINIDSALIVETSADQISLSNGCVCCTMQGDLIEAMQRLVKDRPDLDRIVIEASGVSRSVPLVEAVEAEEVAHLVALDGVFCMVDAATLPQLDYAAMELAIDQVTGADMVILNKTDLVSDAERTEVEQRLRSVMPAIRIVPAVDAKLPRDLLFGGTQRVRTACCHGHVHDHDCEHHDHDHHSDIFVSWSGRTSGLLDEMRFRAAMRRLPAGTLRAKGILHFATGTGAQVKEFQLVGKRWALTPASADIARATPESVLVVIGMRDAIDADALDGMLRDCAVTTA